MPYREIRQEDPDCLHCYTEAYPSGPVIPTYDLKMGKSIRADYPEEETVTFRLHPDLSGLEPGSILGNAGRLILLHRDVASALRADVQVGPVESFPFSLIDEQGRVLSRDYVIFNPLTVADCLDLDASELGFNRDGSVSRVVEIVLDAEKLHGLPDIIRVREQPSRVLFSASAVDYLERRQFTNFRFGGLLPEVSKAPARGYHATQRKNPPE